MTKITNLTQFFEEQLRPENVHSPYVVKHEKKMMGAYEVDDVYIVKASKSDKIKFLFSNEARGRANIELAEVLESWRKAEEARLQSEDDSGPSFRYIGTEYLSFGNLDGMVQYKERTITSRERMAKLTNAPWLKALNAEQFQRFHKIEMIIHAVQKGWHKMAPMASDLRSGSCSNLTSGSTSSINENWVKAAEQRKPELGFVIHSAREYNAMNREVLRPANVQIDRETLFVTKIADVPVGHRYTDIREGNISNYIDEIPHRAKNAHLRERANAYSWERKPFALPTSTVDKDAEFSPVSKTTAPRNVETDDDFEERATWVFPEKQVQYATVVQGTTQLGVVPESHYAQIDFEPPKPPAKPAVVQAEVHAPASGVDALYATIQKIQPPPLPPKSPELESELAPALPPKQRRQRSIPVAPPDVPPPSKVSTKPAVPLPPPVPSFTLKLNTATSRVIFNFMGQKAEFPKPPAIQIVDDPHHDGQFAYKVSTPDMELPLFFSIPAHADVPYLKECLKEASKPTVVRRDQALARGEVVKPSLVPAEEVMDDPQDVGMHTVVHKRK